jgi:hypothetical protein
LSERSCTCPRCGVSMDEPSNGSESRK